MGVYLDALIVGASGAWDSENKSVLNHLNIPPHYQDQMARFCVFVVIRCAHHICTSYRTHEDDQSALTVCPDPYPPLPPLPPEMHRRASLPLLPTPNTHTNTHLTHPKPLTHNYLYTPPQPLIRTRCRCSPPSAHLHESQMIRQTTVATPNL